LAGAGARGDPVSLVSAWATSLLPDETPAVEVSEVFFPQLTAQQTATGMTKRLKRTIGMP
jgi:hypothetical protein